jgi:hypothetical protein
MTESGDLRVWWIPQIGSSGAMYIDENFTVIDFA